MKKLRKYVKKRRHKALTATMFLCFISFVTNLIAALKTGGISTDEFAQLSTTVDGFGAVCTAIIAIVLRDKNK